MITPIVETWLNRLGYADERAVLHTRGQDIREGHPYALEIANLLKPEGAIRAQAVFDVEGVPTVVFVSADDNGSQASDSLDAIRQRIWNQNLATVIIEVADEKARIAPARKIKGKHVEIRLIDARPDGPFSALDVASANLSRRVPAWFDIEARVDRKLLENLSTTVKLLTRTGFKGSAGELTKRRRAELLMGQVLFISYLEHRKIVGATYKARRNVQQLHSLISARNRDGVDHLIDCLREDFNGDFLGTDRHDPWAALDAEGFKLLDHFLRRTDTRGSGNVFADIGFADAGVTGGG